MIRQNKETKEGYVLFVTGSDHEERGGDMMKQQDELGKFLQPWMRKAKKLTFWNAGCVGMTSGALVFAIFVLLQKMDILQGEWIPYIAGGIGLIFGTGIALVLFKPTRKELTKKLDETGLDERAGTMLSLWEKDSEIAKLQRSDALLHIRSVQMSQLQKSHSGKLMFLTVIALLLAVGSLLVPEHFFREKQAVASDPVEEALAILQEEKEELEKEHEEELAEEMDELIQKVEEAADDVEAAAAIDSTAQEVQKVQEAGSASEEAAEESKEALSQAKDAILEADQTEAASSEESGEAESQETEEKESPESGEEESTEKSEEAGTEPGEETGTEPGEEAGTEPGGEAGTEPGEEAGTEPGQGMANGQPENQNSQGAKRGGSSIPSNMTESVYDSVSGSVMYGEVFSAYYADYLRRALEGNVPEDLQDAADAYYSGLDK